ncbi:MAG TPA: Gfo/Idh/MocA family oxidoreductase [Vicinamibacterales bacterium]|nr:Gfo/Idh/MocA family oxidoreductase [Vicinamibacterales bacterium]
MNRRRIRVAIVGAGFMGSWHAHAARRAHGQVVAIVDADRSRADRLAARHRGCRAHNGLSDALTGVDVVHICTPTHSHAPLARLALAAGCHVLLEKPIAETARAAEELLALARAHGRLICPVHQFLFQDGTRKALRALPEIGPVHHVDIRMCSAGAQGRDSDTADRIAWEILPHPLALLARLRPDTADAFQWSVRHPEPGEIRALGQSGAMTSSIVISMAGRPNINRVDVICRNGTVHVDWFHGFSTIQDGRVSGLRKLARPFSFAAFSAGAAASNLVRRTLRWEPDYPGLRVLVAAFYDAVLGNAASPISERETLDVARACDWFRDALGQAFPFQG